MTGLRSCVWAVVIHSRFLLKRLGRVGQSSLSLFHLAVLVPYIIYKDFGQLYLTFKFKCCGLSDAKDELLTVHFSDEQVLPNKLYTLQALKILIGRSRKGTIPMPIIWNNSS